MKIAISAEEPDLTAKVGHQFGTSPYLIIVDTQTMAVEVVSNPAADRQSSAGIMAVVLAISKEVDAVVTGYCSPTAMRYLSENGIEVLVETRATAADAVEHYKQREMHYVGSIARKTQSKMTAIGTRAFFQALKISINQLANLMPIFMTVILSIGLFAVLISEEILSSIFSKSPGVDTLLGACLGSFFAGNPINSYVIGGELLEYGVSLFAVTAFITAWAAVGLVQLPAEIAALGKKFALVRNAVSFVMSLSIAILTVTFFNYFAV